ncbi:MAG: helix-turn-helix domain-containing protein [Bacteroidota bacterium]
MNPWWEDSIVTGIFSVLYAQLFIVGLFNLLGPSLRKRIIGVICLILSLSFAYTLFWPTFNKSIVFNIVLGSYKSMFIPSLVFIYLIPIKNKETRIAQWVPHLLLPFAVHFAYLVLKFAFFDYYAQHLGNVLILLHWFILISYLVYFLMGWVLLKQIQPLLIKTFYQRYRFGFLMVILSGVVIYSLAVYELTFSATFYTSPYKNWVHGVVEVCAFLQIASVLVLASLEALSSLKILRRKNIYNEYDSISEDAKIRDFVKKYFEIEKIFIQNGLDLKPLLKKENITASEFKLYLRKEYNQTPVEFINKFRIEEFKSILFLEENKKYSLTGVAQKVGFSSKATFYRQFKLNEGITPKQFFEKKMPTTQFSTASREQ